MDPYGTEFCYQRNTSVILFHYNYTGKLQNRQPGEGVDIAWIVFFAISCFIVLENFLVLIAIVSNTRFRSWVYYCIANISLSDMLTGLAYIMNLFMSGKKTFQLTTTWWFIREGALFVSLAASIFSLLLTAVERYCTMIKPILHTEIRKIYRVYSLIALCWALAFLIGLLPLFGWNCICDFQNCSTLLPLYSKHYILFCVVMFIVILIGIVFFYSSIYRLVQIKSKTVASTRSRQKSFRLLKTVFLIFGAFIVCWFPLFALLLMDVFCKSSPCGPLHNSEWAIALAVLNSALNPMIYSLGSLEVRKAILNVLCCCCIRVGCFENMECLTFSDSAAGNSTESSLRIRESFRNLRALSTSTNGETSQPTSPHDSRKWRSRVLSSSSNLTETAVLSQSPP
ncbi:sphingosine 1-phosphate receptor 4 [Protopterus annectens]|uniref:sphingosine 1-phosphate receptor 4 n=1 Tax=Protopterus annectens TaxID=7888 RepID=UPI001CFBF554|nr:sphingosine 1-phosphate receptor 4 [Protopterus annectens]